MTRSATIALVAGALALTTVPIKAVEAQDAGNALTQEAPQQVFHRTMMVDGVEIAYPEAGEPPRPRGPRERRRDPGR